MKRTFTENSAADNNAIIAGEALREILLKDANSFDLNNVSDELKAMSSDDLWDVCADPKNFYRSTFNFFYYCLNSKLLIKRADDCNYVLESLRQTIAERNIEPQDVPKSIYTFLTFRDIYISVLANETLKLTSAFDLNNVVFNIFARDERLDDKGVKVGFFMEKLTMFFPQSKIDIIQELFSYNASSSPDLPSHGHLSRLSASKIKSEKSSSSAIQELRQLEEQRHSKPLPKWY